MRRILRSVIDYEDGKLSQEALNSNFLRAKDVPFEWANPVEEKLWRTVCEFQSAHGASPSFNLLHDYFERANDIEATEHLKNDIRAAPTFSRENFSALVKTLLEGQAAMKIRLAMKDVDSILKNGLEVGKGTEKKKLQGPKDAVDYFTRKAFDALPSARTAIVRGDIARDQEAATQAYLDAKHGQGTLGAITGFNTIDKACHGLKPGELWIHAAATGELKTSFAMQWCANLITRYRRNVLYISAEMPYAQIRRMLTSLHSGNAKWTKALKLDPIDYSKLKTGTLSADEERHYMEVLTDLATNPEHCRNQVWCPDTDITMRDVRAESERIDREMEIGLLVIDHSLIIQPEPEFRRDDYTTRMNSVIRDAKKLALQFNGGKGVPVLLLHQINREGKKEADKNGGRYGLHCLASANEAERSADYVTTTYLNEQHRENGTTLICNLKSRDNKQFDPFVASVDWRCRGIFESLDGDRAGADMSVDDGTFDVGSL